MKPADTDPPPRLHFMDPRRLLWAIFALAVLTAFAIAGPSGRVGVFALATGVGALTLLLPWGTWLVLVPLCGLALPVPQPIPGMQLFDICAVALILAGLVVTLAAPNHSKWELHGPGWFALAVLVVPLLAVPFYVISPRSFFGLYKAYALLALLFLALRRLVPPSRSHLLLWVFPLVGLDTALQLLWKTRGLGALLFSRLSFRNFYSGLGWGQSDYISAILEFCICGTVLLALVHRRTVLRLALLGIILVMVQGFLILFSRAGAISLVVFAGLLLLAWRWERAILFGVVGGALGLVALATPGGQVLLHRFSSPEEYGSWYFRLITWEAGFKRFLDHPWTGIGLNQGRFYSDVIAEESANSSIIDVLGDQGILGGILFVLIVYAALRLCLRARPSGMKSPRLLRLASAGTVGAVVIHSLVEPTLTGHVMSVLFVYFLAWLTLQDSHDVTAPSANA